MTNEFTNPHSDENFHKAAILCNSHFYILMKDQQEQKTIHTKKNEEKKEKKQHKTFSVAATKQSKKLSLLSKTKKDYCCKANFCFYCWKPDYIVVNYSNKAIKNFAVAIAPVYIG